MMQKLTLGLLFLFSSLVYGQETFTISGIISDSQNQPVAVGDVLLFLVANDTLVKYTSLFDGVFSLEGISKGSYQLRISCLGFEPEEKVLELDKNITFSIQLNEGATELDEVAVIAAKPIIANENGNLKIDVTNPVFSSIPDPMDLLTRLPNLLVSADRETITVMGKGAPLMYIGNQRISLEEFNALSVDAISSIEIIKNPSAKYEADGRAVLLITRKINDVEGAQISFLETLSLKRNFNNYTGLNGSYQKRKLTLKANFAYNDLQLWESHQFAFQIPEADVFSDYVVLSDKGDRTQINFGGGLFYQINDSDYFSSNATVRLRLDDFIINTDTFLRQGTTEDNIVSRTNNMDSKDFISLNFNYNKQLNAKTSIFTGLQFTSFAQGLDTDVSNNYNATNFVRSQERQQNYRINVIAGRFDFKKEFENRMEWETGVNISNARANAFTDIQFYAPDSNTNIDYDYAEQIFAVYSSVSGYIMENINFNLGLRAEKNEVKVEVETTTIPIVNRSNTNLFPKAMVNFKIDSVKSLTFNVARSIQRPNYSRTSSISAFINPFLEGAGNINLRPTYTNEVSANFQMNKSSLSINYVNSKDPTYFTIGFEEDVQTAVLALRNLEKESGVDIALTIPITKGIWTSTNIATLSSIRITDANSTVLPSTPYLYFYTDHQFKLPKNMTFSFGGWGLTQRSEGIFKRNGMLVLNSAITKTFFDTLDCSLRFNDITRAMNFEERYSINGVHADGTYFADAHEIAFSVKYRFGKTKEPSYKNKDVDENLDRIR